MIRAVENIPVVSYLALKGRCRGCKNRIPIRYPLIEVATGLLFAVAAWRFGLSLTAVAFAGFFWSLVVLTVIDLDHKLLPNRVVFPTGIAGAALLTIAALASSEPVRIRDAAIGALIFGGFFFLIAMLVPAGMGFGDVKLAFVLGMFLGFAGGPGLVLVGMFLAFLAGGVVGGGLMVLKGKGRKYEVPFGPFLALGTVLAVAVGEPLLDLYLGSL
jgi:leader peptidase (prepilin peptidase)/N-methyltransferase